jgi:phage tail sheath protein FI
MAEKIVSPGVFTRENDLSFIAQGVGAIGGAFIGPFKQGPAFKPTIVNTQSEFEDIFGVVDSTYYTENAVQNYLRETGVVTIVRVAGLGGYKELGPIGVIASGSGFQKLVYTLNNTENSNTSASFTGSTFTPSGEDVMFISGSQIGEFGDSNQFSITPTDPYAVTKVFGTSALGSKNAYAYTAFESILGTSHYTASAVILPAQNFNDDAVGASTPYIQSQLIGGSRYNLFKVNTISDGNAENTRFKIVISDVKAAGSVIGTDYATFTLQVRKYSDTDKRKYVLETFSNLNLDPTSPNYIARAIGDRYVTSDANGKITEYGDYSNKSRYIYITPSNPDTIPVTAAPYANAGYSHPIWAGLYTGSLVDVSYQTKSATTASYVSGFDYEGTYSADNTQFLKPIPASATTTSGFALDAGGTGYVSASLDLTGSTAADVAKRTFAIALQGGFDGMSPAITITKGTSITATNSQGFDLSTSAKSGSVAYQKALDAISNQDEYDINLVVMPGVIQTLHPSVAQAGIDLCESRTDCFYIMDSVAQDGTIAGAVEVAESLDTNYAATYYPWIKTIDLNTNKLVSVPPSVLMPAVYAANDNSAAEWFAPAGLNRGGITGAIGVVNRLTHSDRDTLYEGKVNPIAQFPGQGIVAFGQKTLQSKPSALDRINVRRLLITVKKYIASTSRYLVFEQNTTETRRRFLNTVNPYLEGIQQRQGLYAFRVVMDDSNNTPDVIDRNILQGAIFLQPTKTAEFIQIDFNILPTGATFGA